MNASPLTNPMKIALLTAFLLSVTASVPITLVHRQNAENERKTALLQRFYAEEAAALAAGADEDDLGAIKARYQDQWNNRNP